MKPAASQTKARRIQEIMSIEDNAPLAQKKMDSICSVCYLKFCHNDYPMQNKQFLRIAELT